jgi:hypothetical protein
MELAWAAGIYEGEGTARITGGNGGGCSVHVAQKDPWILHRFEEIFGGRVRPVKAVYKMRDYPLYAWIVSGARARGFLMTIYSFLSPRRKVQALPLWKSAA